LASFDPLKMFIISCPETSLSLLEPQDAQFTISALHCPY
jgi:hypothetical protein